MGQDFFEVSVNVIKMILIFLMMVQAVPLLVWVERRGSAFIQNRFGPNRVGPLGLLQLLADAVKFITKEQFIPANAVKALFVSAPIVALIPAALTLAALPLSSPIDIEAFELFGSPFGPYNFIVQGYDLDIGIVFILGISSLGAYSLLAAGWGSGNKYSLMGALRASAQMISYELALGLSIVGILILYGTFNLTEMIHMQEGPLRWVWNNQEFIFPGLAGIHLPNWGIFFQPVGALLFFAATFAETNRLPFDLPEAEAELVAGFHTEYGGFKMLMFFMGEYGHMIVASGLFIIFYLGGYQIPFISVDTVYTFFQSQFSNSMASVLTSLVHLTSFTVKLAILLWIYVWVRWTLPRFRYDQLMKLGWGTMLPWTLANAIFTAVVLYLSRVNWS